MCVCVCICVCVCVCSVCMCMYVSKTSNTVLYTYSHMYHTFLEDILIIICLCGEQTDHHARTLAVSHTHQLHINKYGLVSTVQPILLLLLTKDTYSCTHHRIELWFVVKHTNSKWEKGDFVLCNNRVTGAKE